MKIADRVKGIILNPKKEWETIQSEQTSPAALFTGYLVPLTLVVVVASFIGFGLIGQNIPFRGHVGGFIIGLRYAVMILINMIIGVYISAFVIDYLAPNFGATKNFEKAFQLVVYSYTPTLVAGILYILPSLDIIVLIASIYGLYILYLGLKPMMAVREEKTSTYFIVSLVVMILVYIILKALLKEIIIRPALGIPGI